VFFWLLLKNRLNTRSLLRRRSMELDSYTCENRILQREETISHVFLKCNYVRRCWQLLGVTPPHILNIPLAFQMIRMHLPHPWKMEAITTMSWCICKCRNSWVFENMPPRGSLHKYVHKVDVFRASSIAL
jgi:hypothetical protein